MADTNNLLQILRIFSGYGILKEKQWDSYCKSKDEVEFSSGSLRPLVAAAVSTIFSRLLFIIS